MNANPAERRCALLCMLADEWFGGEAFARLAERRGAQTAIIGAKQRRARGIGSTHVSLHAQPVKNSPNPE